MTADRLERAHPELDRALQRSHEERDAGALVHLYAKAADEAEEAGEPDAACFFLTHAYVFALEAGDETADHLHARLKARGREE